MLCIAKKEDLFRYGTVKSATSQLVYWKNFIITFEVLSHVYNSLTGGESFNERMANESDDARAGVSARSFWIKGQTTFFNGRVFNPNTKRYLSQELCKAYDVNEKEKKKRYNERILQVEQGTFTPPVMTVWQWITSRIQLYALVNLFF